MMNAILLGQFGWAFPSQWNGLLHKPCHMLSPPVITHTHTTKKTLHHLAPLKGQESKENFWFVIEEPWRVKKKGGRWLHMGKDFFDLQLHPIRETQVNKWWCSERERERNKSLVGWCCARGFQDERCLLLVKFDQPTEREREKDTNKRCCDRVNRPASTNKNKCGIVNTKMPIGKTNLGRAKTMPP